MATEKVKSNSVNYGQKVNDLSYKVNISNANSGIYFQ